MNSKSVNVGENAGTDDRTTARLGVALLVAFLIVCAGPSGLAGWMAGYQFIIITCGVVSATALMFIRSRERSSYNLWLFAFFLYGAASLSISLDARATLSTLAVFGAISVCAVIMVRRLTMVELVQGVALAGFVSLVLSHVMLAVSPGQALDSGMLSGIYSHKNILGFVLAASFVACLFLVSHARPILIPITTLYILIGVWQTDSSTAALACLVAIFAAGFLQLRRRFQDRRLARRAITAGAAVAALAAGNFLVNQSDQFLVFLGKSPTLSARTQIWDFSLSMWSERPWTGYGFGAVWGNDAQFRALAQSVLRNPAATHAHSGYIDIILQIGIVGAVLFGLLILSGVHGAWRVVNGRTAPVAGFPFVFMVFLLFYNLVESRFFNPFAWALFVLVLGFTTIKKSNRIQTYISPQRVGTGLDHG